ncbi:ATP-grasp domain-containing protein [Nocardioides jishulii]|uniref:ATP-grasp domain-containing protein n=1 Tax=Nocardioides jishulii TaxID=2575440 RepID=A0A4U2YLU2_9ACTN|nr:ATP-grasp domain-containing protein [Nocardioides jishulii]QCX27383.1 ATP-grasp domain-containing protein [Nocardioides jishulii]TKI62189.1 ATP-grasp domain-containing protein [Nocardioides jishulii]
MGDAAQRSTIVVTGAGGPAGRTLGAQLTQVADSRRLRVLGVDMTPREVTGYESVEAVPAAADPAYDRAMLALIARHAPDLVVPTVADELPRMAVLTASAGLGNQVVLSAPGPAAIAADKLLTMWALAREGIPVPKHAGADEFTSAPEALSWAGGPVVVKPRVARGGRGVHVVEDPHDEVWERLDGSWIVQAFAPRTEYSPQLYRSPGSGRTTVVVLEKTGRKEGRVGNATTVRRLGDRDAPDVAALAESVVQSLDLVGPVDMDVRRLSDGTPVVLEVNSRFGAVSAHAPELLDHVLADWPR